ncbi:unnamed protein product [Paramecium primaurelia]|uniref:Uncharacterized protein n=1 Tax=Paramecium primaurelia TaxID=5886 RepID=A0A8S1L6I9_PARPR|nr:unnamed protein product [Paramecium primaurelia]CAD8061123.1 unnamed protein product [Paramecium primaurelia]
MCVALNKVFTYKSQDIKVAYLIQKATKIDLYRELFKLVGQEIELGFTSEKLPNRDWLVNTFFLVSPNHYYFKYPNFNMLRGFSFQDIQKLKDLNTSMYRSKRLRIFKVLLKNFKIRKQRESFSQWRRQRHNLRREQKSKQI